MGQYTYDYPHPGLTTDSVILSRRDGEPQVLLIQRRSPPFQGMWALPGGFLEPDETLDDCAARELAEETGLTGLTLHAFANFSAPGRDPRGWTVSAAYLAIAPAAAQAKAGDDAAALQWFPLAGLPDLAFDHAEIIARAQAWLADHAEPHGLVI